MKALSLVGPGRVEIKEIAEPIRQSGDLLLKVEMVGLCGTDLNSFRGKNPLVTYPRILGHEISATVVEGNSNLTKGTHVTVSPYTSCGKCPSCRRGRGNACRANETFGVQRDGAITERIAVPVEKIYPSTLPLKSLCLVEPLTVGFHAAARGRVSSQDVVAVFGCGGVGLGAIAGAAFRGARTVAIDLDEAKLAIARLAGATDLINSSHENVRDRLREITSGDGPDVMIEAVGVAETFQLAVEQVAFTGRVVYIGYAKEPVSYETKLFVQKELDILGSRNALPEDFRAVMAMLDAGRFPVDETVTAIVSLHEAADVLAKWSEHPAAFTKIMVDLNR
jgi:2-desacetyl-2-hydroxyethyl bacteriochlorophyllide A dehydrogenase